jgi:catechol-2,3-dioxygenase
MENNLGMRHLALKVKNFQECFIFYTEVLGMSIDWKPDDNNVYLTNGPDNLALHYDSNVSSNRDDSRLDHFGIFVKNKNDIDIYLKHMKDNNVKIYKEKKIHRDNSISFYVEDPDGNILQILWHPTLSNET